MNIKNKKKIQYGDGSWTFEKKKRRSDQEPDRKIVISQCGLYRIKLNFLWEV